MRRSARRIRAPRTASGRAADPTQRARCNLAARGGAVAAAAPGVAVRRATWRTGRCSCWTTPAARCASGSDRAAANCRTRPRWTMSLARRQPGSTLKPFLYELAIERRLITAASLAGRLAGADLDGGRASTCLRTTTRQYRGWISALRLARQQPECAGGAAGADARRRSASSSRLNALGLQLPETGGFYGPSLALGSADVTLLALTNAYRALANGGRYAEVSAPRSDGASRPERRRSNARRVADPRPASSSATSWPTTTPAR